MNHKQTKSSRNFRESHERRKTNIIEIPLCNDKYYILQHITDYRGFIGKRQILRLIRIYDTPEKVTIFVGNIGYVKLDFSKLSFLEEDESEIYMIEIKHRKDLPAPQANHIIIGSFSIPDKYNSILTRSRRAGGVRCKLILRESQGCI